MKLAQQDLGGMKRKFEWMYHMQGVLRPLFFAVLVFDWIWGFVTALGDGLWILAGIFVFLQVVTWKVPSKLYDSAPHGRGQTRSSKIRRKLCWLVFGDVLKECGCIGKPGHEKIERKRMAFTTPYKARVMIVEVRKELQRCYNCGKHTSKIIRSDRMDDWVCWPEEVPEKQEELDIEILDYTPDFEMLDDTGGGEITRKGNYRSPE